MTSEAGMIKRGKPKRIRDFRMFGSHDADPQLPPKDVRWAQTAFSVNIGLANRSGNDEVSLLSPPSRGKPVFDIRILTSP